MADNYSDIYRRVTGGPLSYWNYDPFALAAYQPGVPEEPEGEEEEEEKDSQPQTQSGGDGGGAEQSGAWSGNRDFPYVWEEEYVPGISGPEFGVGFDFLNPDMDNLGYAADNIKYGLSLMKAGPLGMMLTGLGNPLNDPGNMALIDAAYGSGAPGFRSAMNELYRGKPLESEIGEKNFFESLMPDMGMLSAIFNPTDEMVNATNALRGSMMLGAEGSSLRPGFEAAQEQSNYMLDPANYATSNPVLNEMDWYLGPYATFNYATPGGVSWATNPYTKDEDSSGISAHVVADVTDAYSKGYGITPTATQYARLEKYYKQDPTLYSGLLKIIREGGDPGNALSDEPTLGLPGFDSHVAFQELREQLLDPEKPLTLEALNRYREKMGKPPIDDNSNAVVATNKSTSSVGSSYDSITDSVFGGGGSSGGGSDGFGRDNGGNDYGYSSVTDSVANKATGSTPTTTNKYGYESQTDKAFSGNSNGNDGNGDGGGTVICTEAHRKRFIAKQELLDELEYKDKYAFAATVNGYRWWATRLVKAWRKNSKLEPLCVWLARSWGEFSSWRIGKRTLPTWRGLLVAYTLRPVSTVIGWFVGPQEWRYLFEKGVDK